MESIVKVESRKQRKKIKPETKVHLYLKIADKIKVNTIVSIKTAACILTDHDIDLDVADELKFNCDIAFTTYCSDVFESWITTNI